MCGPPQPGGAVRCSVSVEQELQVCSLSAEYVPSRVSPSKNWHPSCVRGVIWDYDDDDGGR